MNLNDFHRLLEILIPMSRSRSFGRFHEANVTFPDPSSVYVTETTVDSISIGRGTKILPNVYLLGQVEIGKECIIWPNIILYNAKVGDRVQIGRPPISDTTIGDNSRIGSLTEIVRSTLGHNVAAQHLSYIGDATIGGGANIGAGSVTGNFDGTKVKKRTVVGRDAFIGINTSMVAPLTIGKEALIGAGAVITKDVPDHAVVVGLNKILPDRRFKKVKGGWRLVKK